MRTKPKPTRFIFPVECKTHLKPDDLLAWDPERDVVSIDRMQDDVRQPLYWPDGKDHLIVCFNASKKPAFRFRRLSMKLAAEADCHVRRLDLYEGMQGYVVNPGPPPDWNEFYTSAERKMFYGK